MLTRILALLLLAAPAFGRELPTLPQTRLYTTLATGCSDANPATWTHPARTLLAQKGVILQRVQLCNGGRYPVLTVRFPFDPQGQTEDYFGPLYAEMRKANGGQPYSFVAPTDRTVVSVRYAPDGRAQVDYEMYR